MKGIQDTSNLTYRQLMGNGLRYQIPKFQREIDYESDIFTIEHILPENEIWEGFTEEEINRSIYKLGNLTLLEKKLNREAGTLSYSEKNKILQQVLLLFNQNNS